MSFMVNLRDSPRDFSDSRCPIGISLSAPMYSESCHVSSDRQQTMSCCLATMTFRNRCLGNFLTGEFSRKTLHIKMRNDFDLHAVENSLSYEWFPRMQESIWKRGNRQVRNGLIHKPESEKNLNAPSQIENYRRHVLPQERVIPAYQRDKSIRAWRKLR